jgi:hypothetical protein
MFLSNALHFIRFDKHWALHLICCSACNGACRVLWQARPFGVVGSSKDADVIAIFINDGTSKKNN